MEDAHGKVILEGIKLLPHSRIQCDFGLLKYPSMLIIWLLGKSLSADISPAIILLSGKEVNVSNFYWSRFLNARTQFEFKETMWKFLHYILSFDDLPYRTVPFPSHVILMDSLLAQFL